MKKVYFSLDFVKKEELKILIKFNEICKKNNIKYSLSGGTLLGAVRHKGFIPWDDDVDVMMTRDNYNKFCSIFNNSDYKNLFLQNYKTDSMYLNNFAKLVNTAIPAYILETEQLDIKRGICIDIFPIDKVSNNILLQKKYIIIMSVLSFIKYSCLVKSSNKLIFKIIHFFVAKIAKHIGLSKLNDIENNIRIKGNTSGSHITYGDYIKPPYKLTKKDLLSYNLFESYTTISFESYDFMVIENYMSYLETIYGDYMKLPPEDKRKPDHNFYYYSD